MAEFKEVKQLVIHGNKSRAKSQGYTQAADGDYTADPGHYNGNPAFCMYLRLSNFRRNFDGSVQCDIAAGDAYLCKFPMKGSHYFGYSFKIYAAIYVGNPASFNINSPVSSKTQLISKPSSARTWSSGQYKTTTSHTIYADNPGDSDVYIVVYNISKCSCNQTNKARPVAFLKINEYIPETENPYIWRYKYEDLRNEALAPSDWSTHYDDYFTKVTVDSTEYTRNTIASWTDAKAQPTGLYKGLWYLTEPVWVYKYTSISIAHRPTDWDTNWMDYCIRPDTTKEVYERNTIEDWSTASAQPGGLYKGEWQSASH